MLEEQIKQNKKEFIDILKSTKREGIENLISYLEEDTDFFIAPASTKYHNNRVGGLCDHSLKVRQVLMHKNKIYKCQVSQESVDIISLLHDMCKANFYIKTFKNVKVGEVMKYGKPFAKWEHKEVWTIEDQFPIGHGCKSVILCQKFIKLSDLEIASIVHHMGVPEGSYADSQAYHNATDKYPFIVLAHTADYEASTFLEEVEK